MIHIIAAYLAVALALPLPWYAPGQAPETHAQRRDRVELIVTASIRAADPPPEGWPGTRADLAAAVLAVTWHESRRWALEVHAGHVRGDRGRSCGLGQTWGRCAHVGTSRAATLAHLRDVARILAQSAEQCRVRVVTEHTMRRAISMYGTGRYCSGRWARPYARLWARFRAATLQRPGPTALALLEPLPGRQTTRLVAALP